MGLLTSIRSTWSSWFDNSDEPKTIGIYGPANAGKSTLANQIITDWTPDDEDTEELKTGAVPHETRRAHRQDNLVIERDEGTVTINIVDTPGVETTVSADEFVEHDEFDGDKDDALERSRQATEGIAEAMHWLRDDVGGVIYVLDSSQDPFTQVNTMLIGIIESRDLPVVILANKTDLEQSSVQRIRNAFPQHPVIPVSALEGDNMDAAYDKFAEEFN